MISLQHVSYVWDDGSPALRNINLEIGAGEFVLVSGRSGSGKSTLGSVINGLIPHYYKGKLSGKVLVDKMDLSKMKLHEIGCFVGTVFQDPRSQFFTTTTDEEIAFGLQTIVSTKQEIKNRVSETYSNLEIQELKNKSVFELSSGQKQKIAIAGVYAMQPPVLILDEPSANLDLKSTNDLRRILKKLKESGTTIILIEHRLFYAKSLFDRFILIENGCITRDFQRNDLLAQEQTFFMKKGLRQLDLSDFKITDKNEERDCKERLMAGKGLTYCYRHVWRHGKRRRQPVLRNLSFALNMGQIIGLVGLNGAGKTTFARMIAGIDTGKRDNIADGKGKVFKPKDRLKRSYFIFQDSDYQLFSESVLAEMLIGLSGSERENSKEEAILFLHELGLANYLEKHPFALSRGEKQRLTIACGLMKKADLFIYDEPTSGCDQDSMIRVARLIKKQAADNKTCLIISHDYELIMRTADEVWVMQNGQIKQLIPVNQANKERILKVMMGGGSFDETNN